MLPPPRAADPRAWGDLPWPQQAPPLKSTRGCWSGAIPCVSGLTISANDTLASIARNPLVHSTNDTLASIARNPLALRVHHSTVTVTYSHPRASGYQASRFVGRDSGCAASSASRAAAPRAGRNHVAHALARLRLRPTRCMARFGRTRLDSSATSLTRSRTPVGGRAIPVSVPRPTCRIPSSPALSLRAGLPCHFGGRQTSRFAARPPTLYCLSGGLYYSGCRTGPACPSESATVRRTRSRSTTPTIAPLARR